MPKANANISQRYAPTGMLAIDPKAFGLMFMSPPDSAPESQDGVCVVNVRGPLMHHCEWFFDSYEDIKSRVALALTQKPKAIVLSVDSPGGLVSGCFDTARDLRKMCSAENVALYAHIGGAGTSAAYAIATAATYIGASQTAIVGSVGVLDTLVDVTQQNAMFGLNIRLISSGDRKLDGNPNVPITDEAVKASQARVEQLASMFFALCEEHGYSDTKTIRALQADVFTGEDAAKLGLVSAVATLDQIIALARDTEANPQSSGAKKGNNSMATPMESARAALQEAADGDDEKQASKAKAALAALDASDEGEEETAEDDKEETAEGEEEDDKETPPKKKEEDAKAAKDPSALALKALAEVHKMKVERSKEKIAAEREKLLASRPDFSDEMMAILQTAPMATVREMVKTLPRDKESKPNRKPNTAAIAAAATVGGERGANQGNGSAARLPADQKAQLDAAMGMSAEGKIGVRQEANRVTFGAVVPKEG